MCKEESYQFSQPSRSSHHCEGSALRLTDRESNTKCCWQLAVAAATGSVYFLDSLNSRLMSSVFERLLKDCTHSEVAKFALNRQYIATVPIRPINFSDPADVARHDRMVTLVEQMLELHKRLAAASRSPTKNCTSVRLTRRTER